ncbi:MAG: alpha/beta hydrolase family protein [Alkalispirochaeta sp.]
MKIKVMLGTVVFAVALAPLSLMAQETTGAVTSFTFQERLTAAEIDRAGEPLFEEFPRPDARYGVDIYEVTFVTRDADGTLLDALATLYLPVADDAEDVPVLAFGSGTTGIGDQCAPNGEVPEETRWGWYRQNMQAYAGQGIITIFPDYVGFNNPDIPQRYFSKAAEGHLMLDALRAVRVAYDEYADQIDTAVRPGDVNVTSGYSQGGHAALAALDMNDEYAPDLTVAGAIGFGSTNSVEMLMKEAGYYSPYIIYTYQQIYGTDQVDPAELLQDQWVETLEEDVMGMCVDEFQHYYPFEREPLYTEAFYDALYSDTLDQEFPTFKRILDENESGLDNHGKPVLMIQGNQDIIVTNDAQRAFVERLRESGSSVDLVEMEGVRHRHTRPAGFARSVEFIFSR